MSLLDQLNAEVKDAMKSRDALRLDTLRLLLAEIKNEKIAKMRDLSTDEELQVVLRQAKRRKESIEAFDKAGRTEMSDREKAELAIIETYLPQQLSPDEAASIVRQIIADLGVSSKKDIGKIMKPVMEKLKGRFPGKDVRALVDAQLPA